MSNPNPKRKSSYAQAAASIKKELTAAFPGIKFSVKSKSFSMGDSVDVRWELGPTTKQVDAIIDKYQDGDFDGMTDCYNYRSNSAFRAANGSAKYVHASRRLTDGLFKRICRDIAAHFGDPFTSVYQRRENEPLDLSDYAHRALERTSFPAGAEYLGVASGWELELTGACAADKAIRIIHSMTDEEAEQREVIKSEFAYIKGREENSTPRLVLVCGQSTLDPDDLINPCIRPSGHAGYCDTGRNV